MWRIRNRTCVLEIKQSMLQWMVFFDINYSFYLFVCRKTCPWFVCPKNLSWWHGALAGKTFQDWACRSDCGSDHNWYYYGIPMVIIMVVLMFMIPLLAWVMALVNYTVCVNYSNHGHIIWEESIISIDCESHENMTCVAIVGMRHHSPPGSIAIRYMSWSLCCVPDRRDIVTITCFCKYVLQVVTHHSNHGRTISQYWESFSVHNQRTVSYHPGCVDTLMVNDGWNHMFSS